MIVAQANHGIVHIQYGRRRGIVFSLDIHDRHSLITAAHLVAPVSIFITYGMRLFLGHGLAFFPWSWPRRCSTSGRLFASSEGDEEQGRLNRVVLTRGTVLKVLSDSVILLSAMIWFWSLLVTPCT